MDYNNRVLCHAILRHIVFTHKFAIFVSMEKNAQQLLVKNATKCSFVRLLAAENDKAKLRNNDLGQGNV